MAKTDSKTPAEPGKSVVPAAQTLPGQVIDYGSDAGAGFEGTTKDDFAIPFLTVIQKMSPQVDDQKPEFIPEARAGMLFNTVTKELFPGQTGVRFIPVHRTHQFLEWVPRDAGGGLVAVHQPESDKVKPFLGKVGKHKVKSADGKTENELVETFSIFGLVVREDGNTEPVILNFSSTGIKVYKQWMTRAMGVKVTQPDGRKVVPPLFAHIFRLTTKGESNNKGSWHVLNATFDGANATEARLSPDSELYQSARAFRELAVASAESALKNASQPTDGSDEDVPL